MFRAHILIESKICEICDIQNVQSNTLVAMKTNFKKMMVNNLKNQQPQTTMVLSIKIYKIKQFQMKNLKFK